MKKMNVLNKRICQMLLCLLSAICVLSLAGCTSRSSESTSQMVSSPEDLTAPKVGVSTGSVYDIVAEDYWDGAEIYYFNSIADALPALTSGKIDCFVAEKMVLEKFAQKNEGVALLEQKITSEPYAIMFPKTEEGTALKEEFNEFLAECEADGRLEEMTNVWLSEDESQYPVLDPSVLPAENGSIKANYYGEEPIMDFVYNNLPAGLANELTYRFCEEKGYGLSMDLLSGDALIAGVSSGKYDLSSSDWTVTEERKKQVSFSDAFYTGGAAVLVASGQSATTGTIEKVKQSFNDTFIVENRWQDFVNGIITTLLVTILSLLFGTASGFGLYMLSRKKTRGVDMVMKAVSWIIRGMPEVLLLLILFYLVFGNMDINGMWVAIIGFALIVCIEVYGIMQSSVIMLDKGQMEGALALGYNERQTFKRIIFPQAMTYILPSYKSLTSSLIKSTAIVGYIAVKDLTKISDIVRSRTFEAFFPLIVTAIIYYVLALLLLLVVNQIQKHLLPIRHDPTEILNGVKLEEEP